MSAIPKKYIERMIDSVWNGDRDETASYKAYSSYYGCYTETFSLKRSDSYYELKHYDTVILGYVVYYDFVKEIPTHPLPDNMAIKYDFNGDGYILWTFTVTRVGGYSATDRDAINSVFKCHDVPFKATNAGGSIKVFKTE